MCSGNFIRVLAVTLTIISLYVCTAETPCTANGWFGPNCQYQCHCAGSAPCDKHDGSCSSGCHQDWFGPACQYARMSFTTSGGESWLTDNDDTTCNTGNTQSVTVTLNTSIPLTWVRVVVRDAVHLDQIQLSGSSTPLACPGFRKAKVDDLTLDIECSTTEPVSGVTLSGSGVTGLCSLYISGGRNVALNQTARQSSRYRPVDAPDSYYASNAVDGVLPGDTVESARSTCTHTLGLPDTQDPGWWTVTFSQAVDVTRFLIYNREPTITWMMNIWGDSQIWTSSRDRLTSFALYTPVIPQEYNLVQIQHARHSSLTREGVLGSNGADDIVEGFSRVWFLPSKHRTRSSRSFRRTLTLMKLGATNSLSLFNDSSQVCAINYVRHEWRAHALRNLHQPCMAQANSKGMESNGCVWQVVCYKGCTERLIGFTLTAQSDSSPATLYSYTDPGELGQDSYTVVPSPRISFPVSLVRFDKSQSRMLLCAGLVFDFDCGQACKDRLVGFTLTAQFVPSPATLYSYTDPGGPGQDSYTVVPSPRISFPVSLVRFVTADSQKILTLCEVFVFGETDCRAGQYGLRCERQCNCANNESCFVHSGRCPSGCATGYTGEDCSECQTGRYGNQCKQSCSATCGGDNSCNKITGACIQGCDPGYLGTTCTIQCPTGKYGLNCSESCSPNCRGSDNACNHEDGTCTNGCEDGYRGDRCDSEGQDYDLYSFD
ncbi:hypothetical protein RRG08_055843 [Elysia crispata]|uniref:Fucolectin-related molecule n=1 Tax=Elysia crispata TaxID=231223 RepID=A0AAE1AXV9_9GAST|nr:hypothetical protein RRG08_055843 [Elysia crispata]